MCEDELSCAVPSPDHRPWIEYNLGLTWRCKSSHEDLSMYGNVDFRYQIKLSIRYKN